MAKVWSVAIHSSFIFNLLLGLFFSLAGNMRLVLHAYAGYNLGVGYCQGMGFIAGTLVMYMPAEEAFWCLVILLENPKYLQGYFDEGMVEIQTALAMVPDLLFADTRPAASKGSNKPVLFPPSPVRSPSSLTYSTNRTSPQSS